MIISQWILNEMKLNCRKSTKLWNKNYFKTMYIHSMRVYSNVATKWKETKSTRRILIPYVTLTQVRTVSKSGPSDTIDDDIKNYFSSRSQLSL